MKTSSRLIIVELVAIAAFAAKANVWKGVTSANMVYTMADYSLPGNWNESEAPNGASAIADFSAMTVGGVFVRIPDSLTLGVAKGSAYAIRPVLVGDGTLVLARGSSNPSLQRVQIYSNFGMSVYPRIMELYQVDVCGDFSVYPYYKSTGDVNFRADRYANSSNPIRETPWGSTGSATWYFHHFNACSRGSTEARGSSVNELYERGKFAYPDCSLPEHKHVCNSAFWHFSYDA